MLKNIAGQYTPIGATSVPLTASQSVVACPWQAGIQPPTFVFFCNDPKLISDDYKRCVDVPHSSRVAKDSFSVLP